MNVKITYPEDVVLSDWDKAINDLAIKKIFSDNIFWDFNLTKFREKLKNNFAIARAEQMTGEAPSQDLTEELDVHNSKRSNDLLYDLKILSGISFTNVDEKILQLLPGKLGDYLGVKIDWIQPVSEPVSEIVSEQEGSPSTGFFAKFCQSIPSVYYIVFVFVAFVLCLVIGGASALFGSLLGSAMGNVAGKVAASTQTVDGALSTVGTVGTVTPSAGVPRFLPSITGMNALAAIDSVQPSRISPSRTDYREDSAPNIACERDEILCLYAKTKNIDEFMKKISSSLPPQVAGNYSVVLRVTPLTGHQQ